MFLLFLSFRTLKYKFIRANLTGFDTLTALVTKNYFLYHITINLRFGGTYRVNLRGWRVGQARNQHEACSKQSSGVFYDPKHSNYMFLRNVCWLTPYYTASYPRRQNSTEKIIYQFFHPEDVGSIFLWKVDNPAPRLHGVSTQKAAIRVLHFCSL
jgi:hypothetical protein